MSPVGGEVRPIHRPHLATFVEFRHPHHAGIRQVHGLIGELGDQQEDLGHLGGQVECQHQSPRATRVSTGRGVAKKLAASAKTASQTWKGLCRRKASAAQAWAGSSAAKRATMTPVSAMAFISSPLSQSFPNPLVGGGLSPQMEPPDQIFRSELPRRGFVCGEVAFDQTPHIASPFETHPGGPGIGPRQQFRGDSHRQNTRHPLGNTFATTLCKAASPAASGIRVHASLRLP